MKPYELYLLARPLFRLGSYCVLVGGFQPERTLGIARVEVMSLHVCFLHRRLFDCGGIILFLGAMFIGVLPAGVPPVMGTLCLSLFYI
jgi:hypothetical protein